MISKIQCLQFPQVCVCEPLTLLRTAEAMVPQPRTTLGPCFKFLSKKAQSSSAPRLADADRSG